jgi:hypothetical protein
MVGADAYLDVAINLVYVFRSVSFQSNAGKRAAHFTKVRGISMLDWVSIECRERMEIAGRRMS